MSQAQEKHLKDYAKPAFTISHVDLNVILDGKNTKVTATSKVHRTGDHQHELVLDGEQISLSSVKLNGVPAKYRQHDNQLFITTLHYYFTNPLLIKKGKLKRRQALVLHCS